MVYIGLSILVASISFLCYKHPPASWVFPRWFRLATSRSVARSRDAPEQNTDHDRQIELKDTPQITRSPPVQVVIPQITHDGPPEKAAEDRMSMPPPPPPPTQDFKKPPPRPPVPSFTTTDTSSSSPANISAPSRPVAMFPALNSAQRASGGTNAPPRLPPAGANSNSNLMAPPSRPISSLPNRGPPRTQSSSSSSLFPPPSHTSIPSKPSKKVLLTPGHSPLDWARLTTSPSFPTCPAYIRVPPSLLKTMNGRKGKDAWTVLGGKVYNISPYMDYHPGGVPELMRCAGREGTRLFAEVHPWVNWEGMLEACLVGIAVEEPVAGRDAGGGLEDMD